MGGGGRQIAGNPPFNSARLRFLLNAIATAAKSKSAGGPRDRETNWQWEQSESQSQQPQHSHSSHGHCQVKSSPSRARIRVRVRVRVRVAVRAGVAVLVCGSFISMVQLSHIETLIASRLLGRWRPKAVIVLFHSWTPQLPKAFPATLHPPSCLAVPPFAAGNFGDSVCDDYFWWLLTAAAPQLRPAPSPPLSYNHPATPLCCTCNMRCVVNDFSCEKSMQTAQAAARCRCTSAARRT